MVDLEKQEVEIGFIPLSDCAVLAAAKEKGFFEFEGLRVSLRKQASWANIRDKVSGGILDGAQMLSPMPLAATLGLGVAARPMLTGVALSVNGNAITVSRNVWDAMLEIEAGVAIRPEAIPGVFRSLVDQRARAGEERLTFAIVAPYSMHEYLLRDWLANAGVDPDGDVRILVIPPPNMADNLEAGVIDGFCVGEPWNTVAVQYGVGRMLATSCEVWSEAQEKVLGVTRGWAEENPNTHQALIRAVLAASAWADEPDNREELARILSSDAYVGVPVEALLPGLTGQVRLDRYNVPLSLPKFHVFHRHQANVPRHSHGIWLTTQMLRWRQIKEPFPIAKTVADVYRVDLYQKAASEIGLEFDETAELDCNADASRAAP